VQSQSLLPLGAPLVHTISSRNIFWFRTSESFPVGKWILLVHSGGEHLEFPVPSFQKRQKNKKKKNIKKKTVFNKINYGFWCTYSKKITADTWSFHWILKLFSLDIPYDLKNILTRIEIFIGIWNCWLWPINFS